jgi:hypothetical protein
LGRQRLLGKAGSPRLSGLESVDLIVKSSIHGTYLVAIRLSKMGCAGLAGLWSRLDHFRLVGLWMARLDVTWLLRNPPFKGRAEPRTRACSKTKLCFNKCGLEGRSYAPAKVSFGPWARGVMAAQYPAKVTVMVRIPPGPFLLSRRIVSQGRVEGTLAGCGPP